jgi:hypothetical protein
MKSWRIALIFFFTFRTLADAREQPSLLPLQQILAGKRFVDLTHAFAPGMPHWVGCPSEKRETIYWYDKGRGSMGNGFFAEIFTQVGQWGTHVDPPAHFARGGRTVDQITLKEKILPLVVIAVHTEVAKNPNYTLSLDRVKKSHRSRHSDDKRRLLPRDLHPESRSLSDRAANKPGSIAGSRRDCHRNFPKSERRFRISGAGLRDRAKLILS